MKKIASAVLITSSITFVLLSVLYVGNSNLRNLKKDKASMATIFAIDNNQSQNNQDEQNIVVKDARNEILKKYLEENKSPFANLSSYIIEEADKNNLDFRTIVAIANCESNLGIRIPDKSFNAWGYGVYGDKVLKFKNWQEGIKTVSEGLRQNYIEQGLETPEEVMGKYTPPSIAIGGPWAKCIRETFTKLE